MVCFLFVFNTRNFNFLSLNIVSILFQTIVAFIIMPGQANTFNVETLKGQSIMRELRGTCDKIVADVVRIVCCNCLEQLS